MDRYRTPFPHPGLSQRDRDAVENVLNDPLRLLETLGARSLGPGEHDAVRQHRRGEFLDVFREAVGSIANEGQRLRRLAERERAPRTDAERDRKSTRLNSSHQKISYAVFCL